VHTSQEFECCFGICRLLEFILEAKSGTIKEVYVAQDREPESFAMGGHPLIQIGESASQFEAVFDVSGVSFETVAPEIS